MPADTIVILLVWLFAAVECVAWDRHDAVYFRTLFWKRWTIVKASRLLENAAGGLALLFPFPPLGAQPRAHYPRIAFSPEGVAPYLPESGEPPAAPASGACPIAYGEIERVEARGEEVLINGRPFVRAPSKAAAGWLAELVAKLKSCRIRDREGLIADHLRRSFDRARIEAAVADLRERTETLLLCANFLWLGLIVGMPVCLRIYGFSRAVVPVLALVVTLHLAITGMAFWAHKGLFGRWDYSMLYTLLPSPFHSLRATDLLAKKLLAGYHPFAVAASLLPPERFTAYARQRLARIRHPLPEASRPARSREIDEWYKGRIIRAMEDAVKDREIDLEELGLPEAASRGEAYLSFCPRCHGLYEIAGGVCADCPEMPLVPLPQAAKNKRLH